MRARHVVLVIVLMLGIGTWWAWPAPSGEGVGTTPAVDASPDAGAALAPRATASPQPPAEAAGPSEAAAPPLRLPDALFPGKHLARCGAPSDVADGRYRVGSDLVWVHGGRTTVVADHPSGAGLVRMHGRVVGEVGWVDACAWAPLLLVEVEGRVLGEGPFTVAGCPIGEAIETDVDGHFAITMTAGTTCTAYVIDKEGGLRLGDKVAVSADGEGLVQLAPPTGPVLDEDALDALADTLFLLAQGRLDKARAALADVPEDDPASAWLRAQIQQEVALFEGELAVLQDAEAVHDHIADFLYGQLN